MTATPTAAVSKIAWTRFHDQSTRTKRELTQTWGELAQHLRVAGPFPSKAKCHWIKLARFGDTTTDDGALRHDANVLDVTGVEGDHDLETVEPEEAIRRLEAAGVRAIVYTTPSHRVVKPPKSRGGPRWRVLAPLSHPHPPEARTALLARVNGVLGGVLAPESFTLSQAYYYGRLTTPGAYQVLVTFDDPDAGQCVDELDELDDAAIGRQARQAARGTAGAPPSRGGVSFADAQARVDALGRRLRTGDSRRALLMSYIASRSVRGFDALEVRALVDRFTATFFDPADPLDDTNVAQVIEWATARDAKEREALEARILVGDAPAGEQMPRGAAAPPRTGESAAVAHGREFPQQAAERFVVERYTAPSGLMLRYWQATFLSWTGSHFESLPDPDVRAQLYAHLGPSARKRHVDEVLDALRAHTNLTNRTVPPAWVPARADDPAAAGLVPVANGLLRISDRVLLPASARLFATWGLPFEYLPDAPPPARWLDFLAQIWPSDESSRLLLQEFCGYLVSGGTALQKALLVVGPKRSGKGTIARVMTSLCGHANVVSPTLASLGTQFGLQPLIGKTLALISDARLSAQADVATTVENILRITGEDQVTIPRKFLPDYTATLPTRIVVLSNEAPRFTDASAALPSRFLVLTTAESFYGRENPRLTTELLEELPGIFCWALDGLDRLLSRGRFTQPAAGAEVVDEMERLASPVRAFVDELCVLQPAEEIQCAELYKAWDDWCKANGRRQPGTLQTFGRDLRAACSAVRTVQKRIKGTGARVRFYEGIRLRTPDDDPPDAPHDGDASAASDAPIDRVTPDAAAGGIG